MEYAVYKFYFNTGVHFGKGSIDNVEPVLYADTLFSALCHESLKSGGEIALNKLVSLAKNGLLILSDCLPFISDELFIPKPLKLVAREKDGNSSEKKAFKKLAYIAVDKLDDFLAGELDPVKEVQKLSRLGTFSIKSMAAIRGLDEAMPYSVGLYSFNEENGLYVIIGYDESEDLYFVEDLLQNLSYSGIGGKTSAGFGKFEVQMARIPAALEKRFNCPSSKTIMTIASSMATEDELEDIIDDAKYILVKRSGFVSSLTYSENQMRKRDFYAFRSGSCFSHLFKGDVFDVSDGGKHPVYRYAKPMLIGVD